MNTKEIIYNCKQHIRNIYADGELSQEATHKKSLLVR